MAERETVANTGVSKESGYLYYVKCSECETKKEKKCTDPASHTIDVWRSQMARAGKGGGNAEKIADGGIHREKGFLYFVNKAGDIGRAPMARGRKK